MSTIKMKIEREEEEELLGENNNTYDDGSTKALLIVITVLVLIPLVFPYYILEHALRDENLCHVGPIPMRDPQEKNFFSSFLMEYRGKNHQFQEQRASLNSLYGTYTAFDDASYYFVKTPYNITPKVLPSYGYWSITTLALTLLSPKLRQNRQRDWKEQREASLRNHDFVDTAPSIQWDQSHQITSEHLQAASNHKHSSKLNRWCLINQQDPSKYQKGKKFTPFAGETKNEEEVITLEEEEGEEKKGGNDLFKICSRPQTSIISNADEAPFFIELPLHPPGRAIWKRIDRDISVIGTEQSSAFAEDDDSSQDDEGSSSFSSIRRERSDKYKQLNPYQIQVFCHAQSIDINHLAKGSIRPNIDEHGNRKPILGWEHAETIKIPKKNPISIPGTSIVCLILFFVQLLRKGPANKLRRPTNIITLGPKIQDEDWNMIRAMQLLWFHSTWIRFCITVMWIYTVGSFLEPVVGTFPYLSIVMVFMQFIAIFGDKMATNFLMVCFGQSVVLSQFEPTLKIWAPWASSSLLEISVISFGGESRNALKVNIFCIIIALFILFQSSSNIKKAPWKITGSCLLLGWMLSKTVILELLGAPQWTIPTSLLAHLWYNLHQLQPRDLKRIDIEETATLCPRNENNNKSNDLSQRKRSIFSSGEAPPVLVPSGNANTVLSSPDEMVVAKQQNSPAAICRTLGMYLGFGSWMLLTLGCILTLDWTLVVGNLMTIWLYIGTNLFPRHPLWSLYHMVASTLLIILHMMTITGWYLCNVAIATRALHTLPPPFVYLSIILQTLIHTVTLFHTIATKHWRTSQQTPGCYFWTQIQTLTDKFCCLTQNDNNKYFN